MTLVEVVELEAILAVNKLAFSSPFRNEDAKENASRL